MKKALFMIALSVQYIFGVVLKQFTPSIYALWHVVNDYIDMGTTWHNCYNLGQCATSIILPSIIFSNKSLHSDYE